MITKFEKYNESIKSLLVGPPEEEVWKNIGSEFIGLNTPPDTVDEFLDYIFENGHKMNKEIINLYRWVFNNRSVFTLLQNMDTLYIYDKVLKILNSFYNITTKDEFIQLLQKRLEKHFGKFTKPKFVLMLED